MQKNIIYKIFFIFLLLPFYTPLIGEEYFKPGCCDVESCDADREYFVEFRMAGFIPRSNRFRDIYCEMGCEYQVEASTLVYDGYYGWLNFDWFSKRGHSSLLNYTRASIANFSGGVRTLYAFDANFSGYVGLGASISNIWLENRDDTFHENLSKVAFGIVLKSGVYYTINSYMYLDLFVDYLYQPVQFHSHVDIGGVKIGAGLGTKF